MKIEEMAKEYAEKLLAGNMLNTYKEYSLQTQKTMPIFEAYDIEQAHEYGAKAVLEEIEKVIDISKYYSDMSNKTRLYEDLVNKINELK